MLKLHWWIFPALTFKWSYSAPSISLPLYVPPFSLPVISTPSALMTSLLLSTLFSLPRSIANSPHSSISFALLSHQYPAQLMSLSHFFCSLLKAWTLPSSTRIKQCARHPHSQGIPKISSLRSSVRITVLLAGRVQFFNFYLGSLSFQGTAKTCWCFLLPCPRCCLFYPPS